MSKRMDYFDVARHIKPSDLPADLEEAFELVSFSTEEHTTWAYYDASDDQTKSSIDAAITAILDWLETNRSKGDKPAGSPEGGARKPGKPGTTPKKAGAGKKPQRGTEEPRTTKGYLSRERGKVVVIAAGTGRKWSNDWFKTVAEAEGFCKANNITLIDPPAGERPRLVPGIDTALALVKRLHNLLGKPRTVKHLVNLLAAIQRAAGKGQLHKEGDGRETYDILKAWEGKLVNALNKELAGKPMDYPVTIQPRDASEAAKLAEVAQGTSQNPLVALILRFIGMQGKPVPVESAKRLLAALEREESVGLVGKGKAQFTALKTARKSLEDYIAGKRKTPKVSDETLNGLQGIVAACKCKKCRSLNGIEVPGKELPPAYTAPYWPSTQEAPQPSKQHTTPERTQAAPRPQGYIIAPPVQQGKPNPITYASHRPPASKVPAYEFTGRWKGLFNSPSKGFSALVYGQPKSGKSTMAIDFAGYLARNFGRVLYASIEEGGRGTLDERISRLGVASSNMDISNNLPADLSDYDFIITDSVSRGNLDLGQMQRLKEDWPDKNFIFLFHTTKDGLPRGTNQFLHEVDVLVNVKDGAATATGRFGPGEMEVRFN